MRQTYVNQPKSTRIAYASKTLSVSRGHFTIHTSYVYVLCIPYTNFYSVFVSIIIIYGICGFGCYVYRNWYTICSINEIETHTECEKGIDIHNKNGKRKLKAQPNSFFKYEFSLLLLLRLLFSSVYLYSSFTHYIYSDMAFAQQFVCSRASIFYLFSTHDAFSSTIT